MANLKEIINLVAQGLITPEQGELLVIDNNNNKRSFIKIKDVQSRPSWLTLTVEKESMEFMKNNEKLRAVKHLLNNRNDAAIDSGIYGLKWCKDYVEEIYANL
jgi:hypothetical protein